MGIRRATLRALAVFVVGYAATTTAHAQKSSKETQREIQTATTARAEMIVGRLSPEHTKAGDIITLRLTDDVRSNGRTILTKGTDVIAIVRSVAQTDPGKTSAGRAQSMIELEWFPPVAMIPNVRPLMITLQSFTHIATESTLAAAESESVGSEGSPTFPMPESAERVSGKSNPALMSMPFIVAADESTTDALEHDFGFPSEEQMYRTGRGHMLNLDGERESVDLFSRLGNDTVITSMNRAFHVTPGARIDLLVGVQRK